MRIPVADGEMPAYRAMPATGGPFPVLLVVQEIFGVHEHIRDICRRLAKQGYMAIAPALYTRQGDVAHMTDIQEIVAKVVSKVPDAQVMSDLDAAVAYAEASGHGDTARLGITGFCWGGRIVWLYAAHSPALKAGVAWYGRLVGEAKPLTPRHPIDIVGDLKAPVLGLYGGADQSIPVETVDRMRAACKAAGKTCELVVYPDARTPSTPTTGRAIAPTPPRTGGRACSPGSVLMVSRKTLLQHHISQVGCHTQGEVCHCAQGLRHASCICGRVSGD